jgi:hypothetical protein
MSTLHLNLMRIYFDSILRLFKKEEYRAISPYWCSKFLLVNGEHWTRKQWLLSPYFSFHKNKLINLGCLIRFIKDGRITFKLFKSVTFSNGMNPPVPRFEIEFNGFEIREGNTDWGAKEGEKYFVLKLGEITKRINLELHQFHVT